MFKQSDHEKLVVGYSDNVFAEYSYRADGLFTWLELWDDEITCCKAYDNEDELRADIAEAESFGVKVDRFFIKQ